MKKKLFSILLSLAMVVTMMPMATMTSFAAEGSDSEAISVVTALGLFGEEPVWEETMTNEDAAQLVAAMGLEKEVASDSKNISGLKLGRLMLYSLGYEGMTGDGWKKAVKSNLKSAGLKVLTSKTVTKEQAAELAFQTIKANMVECTDGAYTTIANKSMDENIANDDILQLGEEVFTELVCAKTETGYAWTIGYDTIFEKEVEKTEWVAEEDTETYIVKKDAKGMPLIGILPWTKAKNAVLFSTDGEHFSYFGTAKPGQKVWVKANRATLNLKDKAKGAMPETLYSKTVPQELTLEKLYDLTTFNESPRSNLYGGADSKGKASDVDRYSEYAYNPTSYRLFNANLGSYNLYGNREKIGRTGSIGALGYDIDDNGGSSFKINFADISMSSIFGNRAPGFLVETSVSGDKAGAALSARREFNTLFLQENSWFKPIDALKINQGFATAGLDAVSEFDIDYYAEDGKTNSVRVGSEGTNPYMQLQGTYSSDLGKLDIVDDYSSYGNVLKTRFSTHHYANEEYVELLVKDLKTQTKTNLKGAAEIELRNALINAIDQLGKSQDKNLTIKLHLETAPKNDEAAVYCFKMPDRMVTADDFGQGYTKKVKFYNNTNVEQTVFIKNGEFGDTKKITVEPKKTVSITEDDGQAIYISTKAVPRTAEDMFLGGNDIDELDGKTVELSARSQLKERLGIESDVLQMLQTTTKVTLTDATTFRLGRDGTNTGNQVVILAGRMSVAGTFTIIPYVEATL